MLKSGRGARRKVRGNVERGCEGVLKDVSRDARKDVHRC